MKRLSDRFFVAYKKRNKNVWVTKKVNSYLLNLSQTNTDAKLLKDYYAIINASDGSYQTPINQLELIALLAKANNVQKILEIGTFKGFTALYLALALGKSAQLTTCELVDENIKAAEKLWKNYTVQEQITILAGDALKSITTHTKTYDLIYIDADKKQYPKYYEVAKCLCTKGGLIILDNMLWAGLAAKDNTGYSHAKLLSDLNKKIYADRHESIALVPAWDGMLVIKT